jgi:small subunit ribosomal protein S6
MNRGAEIRGRVPLATVQEEALADASGELTRWAREYETIYILRPDVATEDGEKIANRIAETVERLAGKITKVDNWGKRKLAYVIEKHTRGIFVYVRYVGYNDLVAELERNLRLFDNVVRFQTIVLRDMVDLAQVEVDPEDVKFVPIEQGDEEPEPDAAERLGMSEQRARADRGAEEGSEDESDFGGEAGAREDDTDEDE